MRIILLGPPGAGKGTQAELITQHYRIPRIATFDMLREAIAAETPLGKTIKRVVETGDLVADDVIIQLVKERILQSDCQHGFLLDGFPRTLAQAEALAVVKIDYVVAIDVPDEEIIKRISGRRIHPASGRVYHIDYQPPRRAHCDDVTGEPLLQREDDREEIIRQRLQVYHNQTYPLLAYYADKQTHQNSPKFILVAGLGSVSEVNERILSELEMIEY